MTNTITQIDLPGVHKLKSGKVREVFDLGDSLLFVATDRISAFNVILPNPIPEKGRVLTALSEFWFGKTRHIVENHFITSDLAAQSRRLPKSVAAATAALQGRSMLVHKCQPLPVECVVRGYLAGSGQRIQTVPHRLRHQTPQRPHRIQPAPPTHLHARDQGRTGHDENIDFDRCAEILGQPLAQKIRDTSLALYGYARDYAATRGIIIADTKFEFGLLPNRSVRTPRSPRALPTHPHRRSPDPRQFPVLARRRLRSGQAPTEFR